MSLLWVTASPSRLQPGTRHPQSLQTADRVRFRTSKPSAIRRARGPPSRAGQCMSASSEYEPVKIQLVNVPNEGYMLTPGEVRQVALDYSLFNSILESGSTQFGCVNVGDYAGGAGRRRGCVLTILQVRGVAEGEKGDDPKIMVECRCGGRLDVERVVGEGSEAVWGLMEGECAMVHDWCCWEIGDRRGLAELEWRVWEEVVEVSGLMRKLETRGLRGVLTEQELSVWAPGKYDAEILAEEWEATPVVTREVWCRRAECFSFGVLRCVECGEEVLRQARGMTNTMARLELAVECLGKKKAITRAQLSLKKLLD